MGHKGVSKRKPKQSKPVSNSNLDGSSDVRPGENASVQSLMKDKGLPLNQGGMNPSAGSNKKHQKGN